MQCESVSHMHGMRGGKLTRCPVEATHRLTVRSLTSKATGTYCYLCATRLAKSLRRKRYRVTIAPIKEEVQPAMR